MWLVTYSLVFATFLPPAPQPRVVEMEACRVGLTPAGQTAAFAATVIYEAAARPDGTVATLKRLKAPEFFIAFMEVDKFESCVKHWKFSGEGKVIVTFSAGTTGGASTNWRITAGFASNSVSLVLR
jgi:hypothetical protein